MSTIEQASTAPQLTVEFAENVTLPFFLRLPSRNRAVARLLADPEIIGDAAVKICDQDGSVHVGPEPPEGLKSWQRTAYWRDPRRRVPFGIFMSRGTLKGVALRLNEQPLPPQPENFLQLAQMIFKERTIH